MVDVDRDAEAAIRARSQFVAKIVRMPHCIDAGAVRGVHRMQRLDCKRHRGGPGVFEELSDPVAYHFPCAGHVLGNDATVAILRQTADDEHEAGRTERQRLVDRALVVVERCLAAGAIHGGEHTATTITRQRETGVAKALRGLLEARRRHLVAPGRDPADTTARAAGDDLRQRPLLAHGRGVDRQQRGIGFANRTHGLRNL